MRRELYTPSKGIRWYLLMAMLMNQIASSFVVWWHITLKGASGGWRDLFFVLGTTDIFGI